MEIIALIVGLLEPIKPYLELLLEGVGALVIFATILVQASGKLSKFKYLDKAMEYLDRALKYAPTLGLNPNTKKLQEWYDTQRNK